MSTTLEPMPDLAGELELARQGQASLLPKRDSFGSWRFAYSYEPAGTLSGDYVDLISTGSDDFYFALGDVSGKGIAASMLMSHLHATLRSLVSAGMGIEEILKIASRTFCHSSLPTQFATLFLGKADQAGNVELVNAGHTPVLLKNSEEITVLEASSVPLGLFCTTEFVKTLNHVRPGGSLMAYSDGVTEALNSAGDEYGIHRLLDDLKETENHSPSELVRSISDRIARFTGDRPLADDRTILVLGR